MLASYLTGRRSLSTLPSRVVRREAKHDIVYRNRPRFGSLEFDEIVLVVVQRLRSAKPEIEMTYMTMEMKGVKKG